MPECVCYVATHEPWELKRYGRGPLKTVSCGLPAFRSVMEKPRAVSVNCLHGKSAVSVLVHRSQMGHRQWLDMEGQETPAPAMSFSEGAT